MILDDLKQELDDLFTIPRWESDPAMSRWLPKVYQDLDYDYTRILEPDFCLRSNGLMLRATESIEFVYCAAFPSPEVVGHVLEWRKGKALLFLHHPIDMEVGGVGFLPLLPQALEQMKAQGISIYACHAPLDCHDEIGTNAGIVQAFQIQVEHSFARYGRGYAGRIGVIAPLSLEALIAKGKEIFGVEQVLIGGAVPEAIARLAIVPGGGDDTEVMEEAEALGAQAYLTGEWYTRTLPPSESEREWAEANRTACQSYAQSTKMALLGFSHAATEYLVMVRQMAAYFQRMGLQVECLEQSDWWR
jgi:putative NIF3 family GTP cyclohydrolase 1 type 2